MKNIRIASAFAFAFLPLFTFAQSYKTAGGIRIDNGVHLTVQQYIHNNWTVEGILHTSIGSDDLGFTVLGEKHHKILFRGTNIYTGAGFHYYRQSDATRLENTVANNVFGLSVIGGAEISLGKINIAIDWKPELHLSGDQVHPFDWNGASVSVRYIFAKREKKKIKDWKVWDKFEGKNKKRKK